MLGPDAIGRDPGGDIRRAISAKGQGLGAARDVNAARAFRPVIMPASDQQRIRVPFSKNAPGGDHIILPFARFKLAAAEHHEAAGEKPATWGGVKQRRINPLQHQFNRRHAMRAQHFRIPA